MRSAIIGFVAGAAWLQSRASLPTPAILAVLAAAALVLALLRLPAAAGPLRVARAGLSGALLGFAWAALLAQAGLADRLAESDEGRDVTVVGTIDSLPYAFEDGVRFNFKVEQARWAEPPATIAAEVSTAPAAASVPPRLALSWYAGFAGKRQAPVGAVQPGERWQLTVRLQRPHGSANPAGFDYEVWLLEQGVRATGYVRADAPGRDDAAANRRLAPFVLSAGNVVERCRARLRDRILAALPNRPYAGVIVALVVGDQRAIDPDAWLVFSRTGVSHLISISGLHITMVAGMAALLAGTLWRRSFFTGRQLPLRLPAHKVAALAGALTALVYVLLAGFGVPAQRTLYMLVVVAVGLWSGRITGISRVLCVALGLVVLLDPWAVLAPGFWLSFGAVGLILYASVGRTVLRIKRPRQDSASPPPQAPPSWRARAARLGPPLTSAAHTQYVVTLGLVPLTLLLFSQVSLVSPIANAVAIPIVSFVVTPLALVGSLLPAPLAGAVLVTAHQVVAWLAGLLGWLGSARLAVWSAPAPSLLVFVFAMAGTLWLLAPRGWPMRWAGLAAWLPALFALPPAPPQGQFTATVFDVGQGMAVLIETAHHRLLYDAGPRYSQEGNGGNRVLVPYLRAHGIGKLDAMVISHSDADHAGGALAVMAALPVGMLLSSLDTRHPIVRAAPAAQPCSAGQQWEWDGVRFDMLHPAADSHADRALKPNARSCTLRIAARGSGAGAGISKREGGVLLAAGDIEALQEAELIARMRAREPAESADPAPVQAAVQSSTAAMALPWPLPRVRAVSSAVQREPARAGLTGAVPAAGNGADALAADVLLAPHHGSGTSSTPAFLAAVRPRLAVFQVGYRNRYHHPKQLVWDRYGEAGIARLRTDEAGAVMLRFGDTVEAVGYRASHPRYWYGQ